MVKQQVKALIDSKRFSQSSIAKTIGVSGAVLSLWLKNSYTGDNTRIENSLIAFMRRLSENQNIQQTMLLYPKGIVKTQATEIIRQLALYAEQKGELCVIYGEAGCGKTSGIHAYLHQNGGTIVITANIAYTVKTLFQKIAENLDVQSKGNIIDIYEQVKRKLTGIKKTIIIDETEHLPYRALDLLRSLQDETGIGLLLVGTPKLIYNLKGNQNQYAQLYSRVARHKKIPKINLSDISAITSAGVSEKTAKKCAEAMDGNFRSSVKLAKNIRFLEEKHGWEIDENGFEEAKRALIF